MCSIYISNRILVMKMLSQTKPSVVSIYTKSEDIFIRCPENQDTKQLISDSYSYLQTLTLGLQSYNFESFIVEHFINKNKHQLFQKQPTAEDLIAYINNHHYITHNTRPSDSVKNEILKRLRIN